MTPMQELACFVAINGEKWATFARGRVCVDSTRDNKDSSIGTARGRVYVDSTRDNKDSSRDSQG